MSVVEVRCPRCGSPCTRMSGKTDEYICSHCNATFRFVDASHPMVTTDVQIHNCPYCGKPIEAGRGFKCTRCGTSYLCNSCVDKVSDKYVCIECIARSALNCQMCKKYAPYRCISCGRRSCGTHAFHVGFIRQLDMGGRWEERVLFCNKCGGFVCFSCAKSKLLGGGSWCPKCGWHLTYYAPYGE